MKQVININFHGQVVPIEVSAFELLKNYTDSLGRYFANEEGKEEIINDIESRIAELFQERLKKGATCITDEDVNAIIKSMGRPEEFEGETEGASASQGTTSAGTQQSAQSNDAAPTTKRLFRDENNKVIGGVCSGLANYFGLDPMVVRIIFVIVALAFGTGILAYIILWLAVPSSASKEIGGIRKKLFRDPDDKIIAGVCSGLGNYFGISAWIPRVFFLLPFLSVVFRWGHWGFMDFPNFLNFSFSPGALITYIIFWLVIPEASSTAEKLEMKGEKVDMNSIKNSVVEEMKGVGQRVEKFGEEAKTFASEKGKVMGAELTRVAKKSGTSLGDVIAIIAKAFAYFIVGCVSFALVVGLFALAIFSIGIFPLKDFVLNDGWQNLFAWGTLLFFIAVPVIGIITWIIRKLAKFKAHSKILTLSFISLWVIGWASFMCLLGSVSRDFKTSNPITEQEIVLSNPMVGKLELTTSSPTQKFNRNNWLRLEPFEALDEDTAFVKNVDVHILQSTNDSFRVVMVKQACGRTKRYADTLANLIQYNAIQYDSLLVLDKGIAINKIDKFRNQRIIMYVYVPVGKQIKINRNIGWGYDVHFGDDNRYDFDVDKEERGWNRDTDYIMHADGLYTLDGKKASGDKDDDDNNNDVPDVKIGPNGIHITDGKSKVDIDENGINIRDKNGNQVIQIDSARVKLMNEQSKIKDSLEKVKESIDKQLQKISDVNTNSSESDAISGYQLQLITPLINNGLI